MIVSPERLADLLVDPREDLDCEIKNWLDLQGSNDGKATFAKAVLAIANHGGGFIILGLVETDTGMAEADGRPATLDGYTEQLPVGVGPALPHGRFWFAYEIIGDRRQVVPARFPEVIRSSVVRHTGWPPFWYPMRAGLEPYLIDGAVECWIGGDPTTQPEDRSAAHSDFWRIHPDGLAFLLRGYQEDDLGAASPGRAAIPPASVFDITLPVWRVGEVLLQARSLAGNLFEGSTTIRLVVGYEGLAGRSLRSIDGSRLVWENGIAHQDAITLTAHIDTQAIETNLPEIVHPLLSPLYALFNFFDLPMRLVVEELTQMRAGRH